MRGHPGVSSRKPTGNAACRAITAAAAALLGAGVGGSALAQSGPALRITPTASISETLTNNAGLVAQQSGVSDAITRGTVGLNLRNRSGRAQGTLDYALSGLAYARQSELNTTQQTLNANLALEWWEKQGFLQASAQIGQGAISAFGAQPNASGLPNANSTEVRTVQLSPRWQGLLFGDIRLGANAQWSASNAKNSSVGDSTSSQLSLDLSPFRAGPLGWSVQASRQNGNFGTGTGIGTGTGTGTGSGSNRLFATLTRAIDDLDLRWSANFGRERGNQTTLDQRSATTWGLGLVWTPTPRTSADLKYDQRLFGQAHTINLQHRTPLTVWRFSSSRALNESGSSLGPTGVGSLYDLYFAQFASVEPDPFRRADLVNAFLVQNGLTSVSTAGTGFLRSAATIDNRQDISAAWRGVRNTATITYGRSQSRRANPGLIAGLIAADDLAVSQTVNTEIWSLSASHRLTPSLSATATASLQTGDGVALGQSSRQRSFSAQIGGPAGPQSTWSLVLRRALFETQLVPYGESTAIASLTMRF